MMTNASDARKRMRHHAHLFAMGYPDKNQYDLRSTDVMSDSRSPKFSIASFLACGAQNTSKVPTPIARKSMPVSAVVIE